MEKRQPIIIESKSLYKTLSRVALPIALQSLIASSLSLVDNLMVGNLGEVQLAAVGLSTQLLFVHWGVMFGFASGSSAFMAQFWGKKDLQSIQKVAGFAITFCFGISFLFFFVPAVFFPEKVLCVFTNIPEAIEIGKDFIRIVAVCFLTISITVPLTAALRATQQTSIPLKISVIALSTNTILNYIFIFGNFGAPALGVRGAALATAIARIIELILYVVLIRKKLMVPGQKLQFFQWQKVLIMKILITAVPVTINEAMWSLGMATYNAAYGRIGVTEFAAIQASSTLNTLFILAIFSLGDALLILVGQRLGMGQLEYAYALAKRLLRIGICIGFVSGILLILTSRFIIQLFNFTPEGQHYALLIIAVYGIFMPLKVYNGLNIVGTFRSGGDTKFAMLLEVSSVWLIGVPLVFIGTMVLHLPVYFVVLLAQTEELVKCILCTKRFQSRKWLNNLVQDI